jgi:FtsH-binding integral membrane protein
VLNRAGTIENDALTRRIYQAFGAGLGAAGGFTAWLAIYWGRQDATLAMLAFFILLGAAVLGHVAGAMRAEPWAALARIRHRYWWAGPA